MLNRHLLDVRLDVSARAVGRDFCSNVFLS